MENHVARVKFDKAIRVADDPVRNSGDAGVAAATAQALATIILANEVATLNQALQHADRDERDAPAS